MPADGASESSSTPTPAEIAKAWGSQGPDARPGHNEDAKVIEASKKGQKEDQRAQESRTISDVDRISDETSQKIHEKAMEIGSKGADYFNTPEAKKAIELSAAKDKGRIALARTRLKHMLGK